MTSILYGLCLFLLGVVIIYAAFTYGHVIIPCPVSVNFWEIDKMLKAGVCAIAQAILKGVVFFGGLYLMIKGFRSM